jgi:hypothetical protein
MFGLPGTVTAIIAICVVVCTLLGLWWLFMADLDDIAPRDTARGAPADDELAVADAADEVTADSWREGWTDDELAALHSDPVSDIPAQHAYGGWDHCLVCYAGWERIGNTRPLTFEEWVADQDAWMEAMRWDARTLAARLASDDLSRPLASRYSSNAG